ncbi:MAG: heavy metal translocating P-type ATPase [Raoultibacter sp.]
MKGACGCSQHDHEKGHGLADGRASKAQQDDLKAAAGCFCADAKESVAGVGAHGDESCGCGHDHEEGLKRSECVCLVVAGALIAASLVFEHLAGNATVAMVLSFAAIAAGLVIVLPETARSLKAKSIDINVLLIVAIVGAVYVQAYEEAAAVLFLFSVGEYLEGRAMRKSSDAIGDLARLVPDNALVVREGQTVEVQTDEVHLGETVTLRPGMSAPLDGVITKGASSFNDAAITGESVPVRKGVGDKVFAASLAVDGSCEFTTTSTVVDSTLAKIAGMVQDAQKQKSQRENFVQRFARIYTPLVIGAAILVAFVPPLLTAISFANFGDLNTWIYRACELLVISCPCAFVISTPVTIVSALTRAAKIGVLVKGGACFEEGARVGVVAFDKTGTLTLGTPTITDIVVADASGTDAVLRIAVALETHSTHPLARAVVAHAKACGIDEVLEARDVQEQAGKGVSGIVEGSRYLIASERAIADATGLSQEVEALSSRVAKRVGSLLYVARCDKTPVLLGVCIVADAMRTDAPATVAALRATAPAKRIVMLTGDNEGVARAIGAQAGVDEVEAGLLPEDKTEHIRRLSAAWGPVAYAGDGINDAPSLATANVGIAMGGAGSDAALSSADVVLMADDLSALPKFFRLSTKTVAVIRQNVVLAIGLKMLVALLVVFGVAQMWMAVLADTGVALLVILNGMRLLRVSLKGRIGGR